MPTDWKELGKANKLKGAEGEKEFASLMRNDWTIERAQRGADVIGIPGVHIEVKTGEQQVNIRKALDQSIGDCEEGELPIVAMKLKNEEWIIIIRSCDFPRVAKRTMKAIAYE